MSAYYNEIDSYAASNLIAAGHTQISLRANNEPFDD